MRFLYLSIAFLIVFNSHSSVLSLYPLDKSKDFRVEVEGINRNGESLKSHIVGGKSRGVCIHTQSRPVGSEDFQLGLEGLDVFREGLLQIGCSSD